MISIQFHFTNVLSIVTDIKIALTGGTFQITNQGASLWVRGAFVEGSTCISSTAILIVNPQGIGTFTGFTADIGIQISPTTPGIDPQITAIDFAGDLQASWGTPGIGPKTALVPGVPLTLT